MKPRHTHSRPHGEPLLSITTPTYHRPDDLVRALRSITRESGPAACDVQLVVSDNSTDQRSETVARPVLDPWPGPTTYVRHEPSLDKTENQNACLSLASGRWQLILHDDDYLLPRGLQRLLNGIRSAGPDEHVLLFGVRVVNEHGSRLRHQRIWRRHRLEPADAVRRMLTHSSFVRIPAICVRTDAYAEVGRFDPSFANLNDYDMWIRLFSRYGVTMVPSTISAYVVHTQAATAGMFTDAGIDQIHELFQRAAQAGIIGTDELRRRKRAYLHQFILAGCLRHLRQQDWTGAQRVLGLFRRPGVAELGWSPRWAGVRVVFLGAAALASWAN